jgi:hypothetical protein
MDLTLGQVAPDAPLRLSTAAKLAFPDGSMTASGLRREANRGRLRIECIAGKHYTTLNEIERMRELCRVPAKAAAMENPSTDSSLSSGSDVVVSAQDALRARLKHARLQAQSKP